MTLGEAGSIASLVGLPISFIGIAFAIGFAIWQIMKLRGETRAATEASAETSRLFRREIAGLNLARVNERIEALKELHRTSQWDRALDRYRAIVDMLTEAKNSHPEISDAHIATLQDVIGALGEIQAAIQSRTGTDPQESPGEFNRKLSYVQSHLAEVQSQWQQSH